MKSFKAFQDLVLKQLHVDCQYIFQPVNDKDLPEFLNPARSYRLLLSGKDKFTLKYL
jgi:hypothetical protein